MKKELLRMPEITANQLVTEHFRCADDFVDLAVSGELSARSGYFRFGTAGICYAQCASGTPAASVTDSLHDSSQHVVVNCGSVQLPFDPAEVVKNFYHERYRIRADDSKKDINANGIVRRLYYLARPLMPVPIRKHFQRLYFRDWDKIPFPTWPVDFTVESILEELLILSMKSRRVERIPFIWFWPEGIPSCSAVTHDVETAAGRDFCPQLMDLNDEFEIKTAFQVVPEKRYAVPQSLLDCIVERGFELNVHDLYHDGHLLEEREEFLRRAKHINRHGLRFGALGFRSAMLHRNLDWYEALDFSYDMSVPNVAHLDPQRGGCCTVFPFFNGRLLELPVTMTQDYTLFHMLKQHSLDLWKKQIALIRQKNGLIQVIVHPDYVIEKRARDTYAELLGLFADMRRRGETWIALPGEVARWWRQRSKLRLVSDCGSLRIEGEGKGRARIAYATIVNGKLAYEIDPGACDQRELPHHSGDAIEGMAV